MRDGADEDFPALLDLWQESWQITLPAIDFAARRPGFLMHLRELIRNGAVLRVAQCHGERAGFITVHAETGYIDQVAVARSFWGKAVGAMMLEDAKRIAPQGLCLKVNQINGRAIAFYEKHGFHRAGADISATSGLPLWIYSWKPV